MTSLPVPITAMRHVEPDVARLHVELPEGLTIAEIVLQVMPGLPETALDRLRVVLVTPKGEVAIRRGLWHRVRPHAGVHVILRVVSGKGALKSVLFALVAIAAAALTGPIAFLLTGPLGTSSIGYGILKAGITLALTMAGGLLINALMPKQEKETEKPAYLLSGWRNSFTHNQPVPDPMGRIRYAPPFAAMSWTEVVGDYLYARALFLVGYGPIEVSDLKFGDTPVSTYEEVVVEVREGWPDDEPQTIFPRQVIEVPQGADLTRPRPRDEYGNKIVGPSIPKPVARFSANDATGCGLLLSFPMGQMRIDDEGEEHSWPIDLDIRYRLAGTSEWTETDGFHLTRKTKDAFFRLVPIDFPVRGRYEIEVLRTSEEEVAADDYGGVTYLARCTWVALQSYRPEYPINFSKPITTIGFRAKATAQLNGTIDNFNLIAEPLRRDWHAAIESWVVRKTRNPSSYGIRLVQGPINPFPASDAQIDWPAFEAWHDFCVLKGLTYDRVHDFDASFDEVKAAIGAAGRAAIRFDGAKWTVVIDRPRELVTAHINPRNSRDFTWSASYFRPPDALRVQFQDETADFGSAERLIPWPVDLKFATWALLSADLDHDEGTEAEVHSDPLAMNNGIWTKVGAAGAGSWTLKPIKLTERLELPGVVNPDRVFIEARRRQHEIMHRAVRYSAVQLGNIRTATPGDLVMASRDVIRRVAHSARVRFVSDNMVVLDDAFEMVEGETYAIRFRIFPVDAPDYAVVRPVATFAGRTSVVYMTGTGEAPAPRSIVHFGPAASDSIPLIVAAIERGQDDTSVLQMLPAAEIIDEKTDAEIPYPWTGRTGPTYPTVTVPAAPRFAGIETGFTGTGDPDGLIVRLAPGSGSTAIVTGYRLYHRLAGSGVWEPSIYSSAAEAAVNVPSYTAGDLVELQAMAIGLDSVDGPLGPVVTIEVGLDDEDLPDALPEASVVVSLGRAELSFMTDDDAKTVKVQIYHNTTGATPTAANKWGAPIAVTQNEAYQRTHGDPTRSSGFTAGDFSDAAPWSAGTGLTIASGKVTAVAGTMSALTQPSSPAAGQVWRFAIDAIITAGGIWARFGGGGGVNGLTHTASGRLQDRLVAGSGHTLSGWQKNASFAGELDNAVRFLETPTCISQGLHYYWFEPLNEDDRGGPMSGPFAVLVD